MAGDIGKLKILYWNANSIQKDIFDFYDYIESNEIDIALLIETFFETKY
jgi:exonuclease III